VGIPSNNAGYSFPVQGDGYAGIATYSEMYPDSLRPWREYIQTEVDLIKDVEYHVSFYVKLASNSEYETRYIDFLFSETKPAGNGTYSTYSLIDQPIGSHDKYVSFDMFWEPQSDWIFLKEKWKAPKSGRYYFTIGDFTKFRYPASNIPRSRNNGSNNGLAYYYISNVKITTGSTDTEACCPTTLSVDRINSFQTLAATQLISVGPITVPEGANVTFIAGNEIIFSPGFQGTDFVAQIGPCPSSLQQKSVDLFPNIVTPNGDGFEDAVCLNLFGGTHYVSEIFNRWGTLVYAKSGPINTAPICIWDGSCNQCSNTKLSDGVYFAVLKIKGCEFRDSTFSQEIHLFNNPYSGLAPQNDTIFAEERKDDFFDDRTDWANPAPKEEIIMGVGSKDVIHQFQVYPNPSTGLVNISLPPFSTRSHLQIFDGAGNLIFEKNAIPASKINIDLSEYAKGVYYIRVINEAKVFLNRFILK
jgi:hypothetical protein